MTNRDTEAIQLAVTKLYEGFQAMVAGQQANLDALILDLKRTWQQDFDNFNTFPREDFSVTCDWVVQHDLSFYAGLDTVYDAIRMFGEGDHYVQADWPYIFDVVEEYGKFKEATLYTYRNQQHQVPRA